MITESVRRLRLLAKSVTNRKLDAIDMLEMDHMKVRALFLQLRATKNEKRRRQIFERIRKELEVHTEIEEAVFYPACEKVDKLKERALEAREEHRQVKTLLREIEALAEGSERWDPKVYLLMENVEHHVREEERELFPSVRRYFDYSELEQLGTELQAMKKKEKTAA